MKKIGFFGGTFDPIHFGHINLAIQLLEIYHLDQVLFCPAGQSPFKQHGPVAPAEDRMAMVQLAIEYIPPFQLCQIEILRDGPSYTIDTLRSLKKSMPDEQFYILLSEDALSSFHRWKEPEAIVKIAKPLIGSRSHQPIQSPSSSIQKVLLEGLTETRQFEISSTQIRERLEKGLYCGHLLPRRILNYIYNRRLYVK